MKRIFGHRRKRFSLEAEHANFDFRGKTQETEDKPFLTVGHGVYGRVFIYMLPILILFALIFI